MSINGKRTAVTMKDVLTIAEEFAIKNPKGIIETIQKLVPRWMAITSELEIPENIRNRISNDLQLLR